MPSLDCSTSSFYGREPATGRVARLNTCYVSGQVEVRHMWLCSSSPQAR